ncbi:peroxisomal membrane protein 11C-like [Neocloeon triangulifer]|uniref:peroxisomal membrane protein 11C-like n=1 Tax=Neocloeon triangulifer TaxID=2078957 RepID=UPI00286F0BBC|nr:peroxisomal membrane protein 11C-like [Neocloeon triangulifer]
MTRLLSELLASSNGRDKIVRTISYASLCVSGLTSERHGQLAKKLEIVSSQLNHFRTVSRLFDDLAMLKYSLTYGLGREEKDKILRILGILSNIVDQLYYPLEHIAWAADSKLITLKNGSDSWWLASTTCWCLSLYFQLLRALRLFSNAQKALKNCQSDERRAATLRANQRGYLLLAIQATVDLGHAVHWLPEGFLWGGKVSTWKRGVLGTVSSLIGLYTAVKVLNKK